MELQSPCCIDEIVPQKYPNMITGKTSVATDEATVSFHVSRPNWLVLQCHWGRGGIGGGDI